MTGFVGWVLSDDAVSEIRQGTGGSGKLANAWLWIIRTLVLLAVAGTLVLGVLELVSPADVYVVPPI